MNDDQMVRFSEIQVGQYFEFQGGRYKKVALSMAQDEDCWGNVFSAETEVLAGTRGELRLRVES